MHLAQIKNKFLNDSLQSQTGPQFVGNLVSTAVTMGFVVGAIAFLFMLVLGGIGWIGSGGDKQAAESARNRITYSIIGIIVLFAAFAIVTALESVFGVNILDIDISRFGVTGGGLPGGFNPKSPPLPPTQL